MEARRSPASAPASPAPAPITVRSALEVPAMRAGVPQVEAGHEELDRLIRWVHAGEVPNMASLLKGGELLLTTGMGLGGTARKQRDYVAALADRGVSGLAIELGTRLSRLPRSLIEAADEHGLPLIALTREVPFVEITEAIHREIVNRQVEVMRHGEWHLRRFTQLVLDGAGIPELLDSLAETIADPVVLIRDGRGIVYQCGYRSASAAVLAAWQEGGAIDRIEVPIPGSGGESWGRIAALALDTPLTEPDRVAIEQAVGLLAVALLRNDQEALLGVRARGDFLTRVLSEEAEESHLRAEAAGLGFAPREPLLMPLAASRRGAIGDAAEQAWMLVWKDVERELRGAGIGGLAGTRPTEGDLLAVLALERPEDREPVADRVATAMQASVRRRFGEEALPAIGVGLAVESWTEARDGLREAVGAALAGLSLPPVEWHDAHRPDVSRLLWELSRRRELRVFVERRLGPLIAHDRERSLQLIETLEAYFANGLSKARTARALHLERQSLYHRLERIERLLGERIDDGETALGLHLALRSRRLIAERP